MANFSRIALGLVLFATAASAAPLTLKEAIRLALENSPIYRNEIERAEISDLELSNRVSKFLPSLDIGGTHGLQKTTPESPTHPWTSQMNIGLTETFYDNGESIVRYNQAKVQRELALLNKQKARDSLIYDVISSFYRFSLNKKLAEAQKKQLETVQKQSKFVTDQYQQGLRTRKDFLRIRTAEQRARIQQRNTENNITQAAVKLKQLLGGKNEMAMPDEFVALEQPLIQTTESKARLAKEGTYEFRVAKLQLDQAPFAVKLAQLNYWPRLSLTSGVSYQNGGYLGPNSSFTASQPLNWNVLLTVNYNIWDWGIRRRDVEKERANFRIQENEFQKTSLQVNADLQALTITLEQAFQNYEASKELLKNEEETFGLIRKDYEEGKVPYIDMITSLNDLLSARNALLNAQFDLGDSLAKYHYYRGDLYETVSL